MKGYMYILECSDGSYYTGSTNDLERRLEQHQNGEGANHTKKHLPVKRFVELEEFEEYRLFALDLGFRHVESSPLVRSSYHAEKHIH